MESVFIVLAVITIWLVEKQITALTTTVEVLEDRIDTLAGEIDNIRKEKIGSQEEAAPKEGTVPNP